MTTVYQYLYDKMIKKREEMRSYLLGPLSDDLPEEYKPIRELYYHGSAKGKSYVEEMIIKTTNDTLLIQLEKLDRLRLLENGKDMFSLVLTPKEYNSVVFVPKNLSFCSIMKELIEEEKNNPTSQFVY
ncbi:transposase [Xenorhabdus sp. 12]|uniref:Transposase n=1 Tax=Xenorhabdus santafensis TaxID=2582833 RepID=A0ABU4SFF2_9GAMM|nr:transposase [Xenorhabdus sp. 12]MDX7989475.1 transposase [Xenorhabdus sp. 12]